MNRHSCTIPSWNDSSPFLEHAYGTLHAWVAKAAMLETLTMWPWLRFTMAGRNCFTR